MTTPAPDPQTPQGNTSGLDGTQNAGSAQAQRTTELRSLAMALATPEFDACVFVKGVVTAVSLPSVSVQIGGDTTTTISGVRFLDHYSPVVGDTVFISKQGSEIVIHGQMAVTQAASAHGWTNLPSLTSGLALDVVDPAQYRLVLDHGSKMIQLRGKIVVNSGTPTTLWTFPAGELRPSLNMGPLVIARNSTHATTVLLFPNQNGTMTIEGQTSTADFSPANTGGPSTNNTSYQDGGFGGSPSFPFNSTRWTEFANGPDSHRHDVTGHAHNMSSHTHGMSHTHAVSYPTNFSLNGVQYHLL